MKDTSLDMESLYHRLLMARSGEERFNMGLSMLATARSIVVTSIRERTPEISLQDLLVELFKRFYGNEMDEKQRKEIIKQNCKTFKEMSYDKG